MSRALKLMGISFFIFIVNLFISENPGTLFGYTIATYSQWFNLGFILAYSAFSSILIGIKEKEDSGLLYQEVMEFGVIFGGIAAIVTFVMFGIQAFFGGNFILPVLYILALVCSIVSIIGFFYDKAYKNPTDFIVYPVLFSSPLFGMAFFVNIVPLAIILWAPYLVICGVVLFFAQYDNIARLMEK